MRTLEVRRHLYTKHGAARGRGSHLSQAGVELARSIGQVWVRSRTLPPVIFRVRWRRHLRWGLLSTSPWILTVRLWDAAQVELPHRALRGRQPSLCPLSGVDGANGAAAALGRRQLELWTVVVSRLPDGARALLISHGDLIESGLVAALPDWPHARWGRGFRHGEGVLLRHNGLALLGRRRPVSERRAPPPRPRRIDGVAFNT